MKAALTAPAPKREQPAWLVVAMHVHLRGLPCGAKAGKSGAGWGAITCPECIALVQACPEPLASPAAAQVMAEAS